MGYILVKIITGQCFRWQSTRQLSGPNLQSKRTNHSEKQKTQHRVRRKEKSGTFEPSPYQNIFSECKFRDIRDTVTKVHRKGIITYEEGVLILTEPTKERLNNLFTNHFDVE